MSTAVITFDEDGRHRTVWGVPDDPRIVTCPECRGELFQHCWMCLGVGLIYCQWLTTRPVEAKR